MRLYLLFLSILCLLCITASVKAQTCRTSLGDPIVNVAFGSGANYGPPLPAGTTSSLQYQGANCPPDGYYSINNYSTGCWPNDVVWHTATDHTGDANGYYMLINASNQPSNFYIQTINGLCAGTTYQFAAWLLNMCSVTGIKPNITFTIEKLDGTVLGSYNTGDIPMTNPATWVQYGLYFTTPAGVSSVVLRMRNNSPGGVGNDLGLDDITFRPAGAAVKASAAGISGDTINLCADDLRSLTFQSTVENCYVTTAYQWQLSTNNGGTWNNIAGATTASYTRTTTAPGKYLYRLLIAESINIGITTCRVASNPITVNINPLPVVTIRSNSPRCAGDTLLLTATGGNRYSWSGPNAVSGTANNLQITNTVVANSGMYYVTVTDSLGCVNNDSLAVVVHPTPVADFSMTAPLCEKNSVQFSDRSITGGQALQKWNWNFGDGTTTSNSNPSHVFATAGKYSVSFSVENVVGCKSQPITKDVTINPLPEPDFIVPAICLADSFATFINTSVIKDGSESLFTHLWNFGDANAMPASTNTSTLVSPDHSYKAVGIYPVKLTVTSKDGCVKDTLKNFTVNGSQPVAKFGIDPAVSYCSNTDLVLQDQSTVNFGSITRIEVYWDYGNDISLKFVDSLPSAGKRYTHRYPAFTGPATKDVQLRYVVYSGISCVNELSQTVTLKASPVVQFLPLPAVCENAMLFTLTQATEISGLSGIGSYSGAAVNTAGLFDPAIAKAGTHTIRYTFTAGNSCTAYAEQLIKVYPQPVADAGPDRTLLSGMSIILNAAAQGDSLRYEWLPLTAIENNLVLQPKVAPLADITYTFRVVSKDGCEATDDVFVKVVKDIFVPNAFTPNGDGLNDVWEIAVLNAYPGASVKVYNRYGQLVYQSTVTSKGWDGMFNGKQQPIGTYAWVLDVGDGRKKMHGIVNIVR
ncbi:T9SS type B sorting domain-containing protein [Lacibacter luteus]|uniref:T9SS type B sorting domain-containing protein n=1 Tax=Lacibacter luteus TaxID=2508719 RepID=A0A4Q1CLY8_9BACT|nr:PKD domain-containing protein [Lacibacter luteus]RXK62033.1 T9SS type B sorting domain-containing protein [Lacibacter luteus]